MNIHDIREDVKTMLAEVYKDAEEVDTPASPVEIEAAGFMRKEDAEAIRTLCKSKALFVSFRAAGPDSLQRIRQGCPCKGHDIMDKSIKISKGRWTYQAPDNANLGTDEDAVLEALKGYVGCPYIPRKRDGSIDYEAPERAPKIVNRNPDGTIDAIFHLDEVYVLPTGPNPKERSGCSYAKLSAQTLSPRDLVNAYTGDYDMHDLILKTGRPLATTPDENDAIDLLNKALLDADKHRNANVSLKIGERRCKSPYALIRHGAQTSFFDFLTSNKGEENLKPEMISILGRMKKENYVPRLPYGSSVVKIDDHIAMFDNTGKIYILKGVGQIYKFYLRKELINFIPFYNFFDALYQNETCRPKIASYASYINEILTVNLGLIKRKR